MRFATFTAHGFNHFIGGVVTAIGRWTVGWLTQQLLNISS